ncbi:MAG TPA: hypothetical protein VHX38_15200 [Pseudonocardiaceae bacterium]|jgi:hypothetical protein|nr:hypothetical protein [Pseudonocardiaceae bacterium]
MDYGSITDCVEVLSATKDRPLPPYQVDDPVLALVHELRARITRDEETLRLVLAYARHLVFPRPYMLKDLADHASMSISGIRTAYADWHVERAHQLLTDPTNESRKDTNQS